MLDFEGVNAAGPSWLDEVYTNLKALYGKRVKCRHRKNASVIESLKIIEG